MDRRYVQILTALAVFFSVSCQDKEMVAKNREQERRIEALRAELDLVKVKLDANWSRDLSGDLEDEELKIEKVRGIISDLEKELKELEKERKAAEESFEAYRKKYPVG